MLTVVILYWNRAKQLMKTLESFTHSEYKDFNVVIVDNNSPVPIELPSLPYEVRIIRLTNQNYNFIAAHNYGFYYTLKEICPDRIIMQHAECYHKGDVISYANRVNDETYISFACYSIGTGGEPETVMIENRPMKFDGDNAWYNHPTYRPRKTHFCSAITANNLRKLNGFDERFCDGLWYDDDYFLLQLERLGLKIELTTDPFVYHQNHEIAWGDAAPIYRNQILYNKLKNETSYEAVHTLTPDFV